MPGKKFPFKVELSAVDKISRTLGRVQSRFQRFGASLRNVGSQFSTRLSLPIAIAGAAVVKVGATFEAEMNRVRVLSRTMGKENEKTFNSLRKLALRLGRTTQFSATQAAEGMNMLAMAGFNAKQIMQALPGVLNLAAAAKIELGEAADITTNILTGYGKKASEVGRVNDILVATFTRANTTLVELGEAFKFVGPVAKASGISIEETAAFLGKLADAGITGTLAGNMLKRIFINLAQLSKNKEGMKILATLGIRRKDIFDAKGNIISLTNLIKVLEKKGLTTSQAFTIFGARAAPGILALISQGSKKIGTLLSAIKKSKGLTKLVGKAQMKGAMGAFLELKSAFEGLMIAIGDTGLLRDFATAAKSLATVLQKFSKNNTRLLKTIVIIGGILAALGPVLIAFGVLATAIGKIVAVVKFAAPLLLFLKAKLLVIVPVIGLLALAGFLLWRNWARVSSGLKVIWNTLKAIGLSLFSSVRAAITGFMQDPWIQSVLKFFRALLGLLKDLVVFAASKLKNFGVAVFGSLQSSIAAFLKSNTGKAILGFFNALLGLLKSLKDGAAKFLEPVIRLINFLAARLDFLTSKIQAVRKLFAAQGTETTGSAALGARLVQAEKTREAGGVKVRVDFSNVPVGTRIQTGKFGGVEISTNTGFAMEGR
jgi:TP901 family phage tail tape measure protein